MPEVYPQDPLKEHAQAALVEFLTADLHLAFAMMETARLEAKYDPAQYPVMLEKIAAVLDTVRRLEGRIEDSHVWKQIHTTADELGAAISTIQFGR
jgi:hypothetical protein